MNKQQILSEALAARDDEITGYQINIDNYRLAIEKIAKEHTGRSAMDEAMQAFSNNLRELLQSSLIEQRKAQIIRDVIAAQLEA